MTFWLIVAGLLALALAFLVLPMLRRSPSLETEQRLQQNIQIAREQKQLLQAQRDAGEIDDAGFDSAYRDLQTALALELDQEKRKAAKAPGKWMLPVVMLAIPLASIALYLNFGEYRVVENPQLVQAPDPQQNRAAPQMTLDEMQTAIREKLRDNPEDAEGWFMLGRTYMAKREFALAVTAYQRAHDLTGDEPGVMFALADALAMQNNDNLLGEPETLLKRGLEIAPNFPNGLWLAGMAAEQRGEFAAAHAYWTRLLPLIQDNPDSVREIRALLTMLEERDPTLTVARDDGPARPLSLSVDISPELRAKAGDDAAVFVYAKAMQGPPMPLAVKRLRLRDLPATLTLGDEDAMMPAMKLSSFDQVVVGARVSFSGNPVAQAGDFYTEVSDVDSDNPPQGLALVIDRIK